MLLSDVVTVTVSCFWIVYSYADSPYREKKSDRVRLIQNYVIVITGFSILQNKGVYYIQL
jgi:hypothetical protein